VESEHVLGVAGAVEVEQRRVHERVVDAGRESDESHCPREGAPQTLASPLLHR
jgi:hypothetical protein